MSWENSLAYFDGASVTKKEKVCNVGTRSLSSRSKTTSQEVR
jgi:hypothetical protein